MGAYESEHWQTFLSLIDEARDNEDLRKTLQTGSPAEVTKTLAEFGLGMEKIGEIFSDLELVADRNSLQYWSPLR